MPDCQEQGPWFVTQTDIRMMQQPFQLSILEQLTNSAPPAPEYCFYKADQIALFYSVRNSVSIESDCIESRTVTML